MTTSAVFELDRLGKPHRTMDLRYRISNPLRSDEFIFDLQRSVIRE